MAKTSEEQMQKKKCLQGKGYANSYHMNLHWNIMVFHREIL